MERRRSRRKTVNIGAEIASGDTKYQSIIENLSEVGFSVETDTIDPLDSKPRFSPGDEFEVVFNTPSGEPMQLNCRIIWAYKSAPDGLTQIIGMEIIDPSDAYLQFYKAL